MGLVHKVSPGLAVPQIGHLFSLNHATGKATDVSDVGDQEYAWAGEHKDLWKEFPDSSDQVLASASSPSTVRYSPALAMARNADR